MSAKTMMAIFINFGMLGSAPLLQDVKPVTPFHIQEPAQWFLGIEQKLEKTVPTTGEKIQNILLQRTFHNSA